MEQYSFDIKIADFLRRCFAFYIRKRLNVKVDADIEIQKEKIWNSLFNYNNEYEYYITENTKISLYRDSILCKAIYFGYEEEERAFLKRYLKKGDCFIDIGANIGLYSLIAAELVGSEGMIISFEPAPITYQRLLKNVSLNNNTNIIPKNLALSNRVDELKMNISIDGYDAWNSFADLPQLENSTKINVNLNTLDNIIKEDQKIDLIKLDVEGWEHYVLEGSKETLSRQNPPVILVEFNEVNSFAAGCYCGNIYDLLVSHGYDWYKFDIQTNLLIKQTKKLHYVSENLIAIKNIEDVYNRLNDIEK